MSEEAILKQQLQDARMEIEVIRDFIEWLFDNELDYTSFREQWEKFENLEIKEEN
jgi:hypothetical protein